MGEIYIVDRPCFWLLTLSKLKLCPQSLYGMGYFGSFKIHILVGTKVQIDFLNRLRALVCSI